MFASRVLTSVVLRKQWSYHRMGIGMSRAFDTTDRGRTLRTLSEAGCTTDELRIARFLLADTVLRVRIGDRFSDWFQTTVGSPQGDSLSPALFTRFGPK